MRRRAMSVQQREALALANTIRAARHEVRSAISSLHMSDARADLIALFEDPPACVLRVRALDVLHWPKRALTSQGERLLRIACANPYIQVGELSERQRRVIAAGLRVGRAISPFEERMARIGFDPVPYLEDLASVRTGVGAC